MSVSNENNKKTKSNNENSDTGAESPWSKAAARSMASLGTWFATEYPKLIFQQQKQSKSRHPLVETLHIYRNTCFSNHVRGATSSAAQRGSSALIMFYGQHYILGCLSVKNGNSFSQQTATSWYSAGLAGFLSGGASSLIHTLFEPIKIRHEPLTWNIYRASLLPMAWRHALFDSTFFAASTALEQSDYPFSYATQFGLSALAASTVNLTHDLWKTQFIRDLPNRQLKWMAVVKSLSVRSFRQQLYAKAADLGLNWWFTGFLYALLFASS